MKWDEIKALCSEKAKPRHEESQLQQACKRWFDYQYPDLHSLYFAVPNGGSRNAREAAIMKREGIVAGVADTILLVPRHGFGSLCVEFKTATGKQSTHQKAWQKETETAGNKYVVIRDLETFISVVKDYLK